MVYRKFHFIFSLLLFLLTPALLYAETDTSYEASVIKGIIQHIEWPDSTYDDRDTLTLCTTSRGKKAEFYSVWKSNNNPITIIEGVTPLGIKDCHVLFIDNLDEQKLSSLLNAAKDKPILTISHIPNFITLGGMVEVKRVRTKQAKSRVWIDINAQKAEASYLTIDPKLLRLVKVMSIPRK